MSSNLAKKDVEELLKRLPGMLYRCKYDENWTMEFVSDGCYSLIGYTEEEILYNKLVSYATLIHKDDAPRVYLIVEKAIEAKTTFSCEYRIITKSGKLKWVWEQGIGIYDENNLLLNIEGFITDISLQKLQTSKLEKEILKKDREVLINSSLLNEYKRAVDQSAIVTKTNKEGIVTYVNDEFCKISGYSREEVLGHSHNLIRDPDSPKELYENLWNTILDKRVWKGVIKNRSKDNKFYYVKTNIVPILDVDGEIKEFMAIRHDVTDLIQQEKKIKFQTTDHLTHLANRQKLLEDLEEDKDLKLAIINIEEFKEINEYYGFDIGDKLLVKLANMLCIFLSSKPTRLYKLSGSEFAILVDDTINKEEFRILIKQVIQNIKDNEYQIEEYSFKIRVVSGAAMQKNYFINAQMATNHAKIINEEFLFFDENLDIKEKLVHNVNWTNKLKEALDNDRLVIYIQPIICNKTLAILKYECLIRMIDTDGKIILPAQFLRIAKKSKLYPDLTKVVIEKAVEYFKDKEVEFAINLTLDDMLNPEIVELLEKKISENNGLGNKLTIEIVEDEGIENYKEVSGFIENMKFLGCKIAIDDFGTGYSNFDYLMRLDIDFIKIDGSIIKNVSHDKNAKVVTEVIVSFAKRLNIKTVAEFVCNKEILDIVSNMGIDYSQGYYLGKPTPI